MNKFLGAALGIAIAALLVGSFLPAGPSLKLLPAPTILLAQIIESNPTPPIAQDPSPPIAQDPSPPIEQDPTPLIEQNPSPPIAQDPSPPVEQNPSPPIENQSGQSAND
jgi:hypothetical protein